MAIQQGNRAGGLPNPLASQKSAPVSNSIPEGVKPAVLMDVENPTEQDMLEGEKVEGVIHLEVASDHPPVPRGKGIWVEAIQAGFYQGARYLEGDRFEIAGMHRLGDWMKCESPEHHAKHQEMIRTRKLAGRS